MALLDQLSRRYSRPEPDSSQPATRPTKNPGKYDSTNNPDKSIGQERLIWHNGQIRPAWSGSFRDGLAVCKGFCLAGDAGFCTGEAILDPGLPFAPLGGWLT